MIELADLKRWLGVSGSGDDTLLTDLEARAVDFLERETGRHFGTAEAKTEIHEGDGTPILWLNELPSSLTSVEERQEVGDSWTAIPEGDDDGWELRAPKVLRKGSHVWDAGYEFRVIYNFGYTAGNEPKEVRQAVLDLCALKYHPRGQEGFKSGRVGDFVFSPADAMAVPGLEAVIRRWRWPRVR
jgi:hypothetical protein